MSKGRYFKRGLPVSISLSPTLEAAQMKPKIPQSKKRLITISLLAIAVAIVITFIAKFLMFIIGFISELSFFGNISLTAESNPSLNHMGIWVIFVPAIGGLIVGFMALYGSQAIRGHGIPEAMEQILTNKSKIKPTIVYLKPISSAIAIGTGGPFGAEGPIIATGGALGSTLGQILKITHNERKILLAAGAAAGMATIFGSPVSSIFLAIELLLFEFSPRSLIPVALACITGAAGHHLFFGQGPVFPMASQVSMPGNIALLWYSILGLVLGFVSIFTTKSVFWIEDLFAKIPIKWYLYPALGGLVAGIIGYFAPRTLGVGYYNIKDILTGHLPITLLLSLSILKFLSWTVALGSGTSGGTLAPLLTIGGAAGLLFGMGIQYYFPHSGISLPLAALIGMSALFAGASRALLTSIIFAIESTGQSNALLPLLAACSASYFISFFFMKYTIMTEKIARKGVKVPESYEPDILEKIQVSQVNKSSTIELSATERVNQVKEQILHTNQQGHYFMVRDEKGKYLGQISILDLFGNHPDDQMIGSLITGKNEIFIQDTDNLLQALLLLLKKDKEALPVKNQEGKYIGLLTYKDILSAYQINQGEFIKTAPSISLKRRGLRILAKGSQYIQQRRHRHP